MAEVVTYVCPLTGKECMEPCGNLATAPVTLGILGYLATPKNIQVVLDSLPSSIEKNPELGVTAKVICLYDFTNAN